MNRSTIFLIALAYLAAAAVAAAYIAGCAYFVISKALPHDIELDTWYRYWCAYAQDPLEHKRLVIAAAIAVAAVCAPPLLTLLNLSKDGRSLHGDARWANHAEIRKAGLL